MKKYGKFAALVVIVLGAMVWLAFSGSSDSRSYYKTISELGKMGPDGVFHATQIQAKCASKYEAKPGLKPGQAPPNINTNPAKSI